MKKNLTTLTATWALWIIIILTFQAVVVNRIDLQRPDKVLSWTPNETGKESQDDQPYILDPSFNNQVAWDSEYYISISKEGYNDPIILDFEGISLNYAFFPFYPFMIKILRLPFSIFLSPVGASTAAGILISALGTLGAMIALYFLTGEQMEKRLNSSFYLLIFPTSFFLLMVYTEGLFLGLTFGTLAFLKHKKWLPALVLASLAVWTKGVGVLLIIPFFVTILKNKPRSKDV